MLQTIESKVEPSPSIFMQDKNNQVIEVTMQPHESVLLSNFKRLSSKIKGSNNSLKKTPTKSSHMSSFHKKFKSNENLENKTSKLFNQIKLKSSESLKSCHNLHSSSIYSDNSDWNFAKEMPKASGFRNYHDSNPFGNITNSILNHSRRSELSVGTNEKFQILKKFNDFKQNKKDFVLMTESKIKHCQNQLKPVDDQDDINYDMMAHRYINTVFKAVIYISLLTPSTLLKKPIKTLFRLFPKSLINMKQEYQT